MTFIKGTGTAFLVLISSLAFGQQRPQFSQYMNNQLLLNPSITGTAEQLDIKAGFRQQWAGIDDAPRTSYLSGQMSFGQQQGKLLKGNNIGGKSGHGLGFIAMKDQTGPLSWTSGYVSYAFRMQLSRQFMVSFGASAGFQQFLLDGTKLRYVDNSVAGIGTINNTRPDANIGVWLYSQKLFLGASMLQIIPGKIDGYNTGNSTNGTNQLAKHFYVTTGYHFDLNKEIAIVPSVMVKLLSPAPPSLDINCKVKYKNTVWAGISYRNNDGLTGMAGFAFLEMFNLTYAYDYITSDLNAYQSGSHEVILGFRLNPKKKFVSPADFW